ncbi:hypothetical protein A4G21_16675 [Brucella intermedia]|nr:hypothetical protein A4G21_16675 [Brucella intermedia]
MIAHRDGFSQMIWKLIQMGCPVKSRYRPIVHYRDDELEKQLPSCVVDELVDVLNEARFKLLFEGK